MSTVSLVGILAGPSTDGAEAGRAAGDDGSAFGAALTAAGRLFEQDATDGGTSDAEHETTAVGDVEVAEGAADAGASAAAALLAAQILPAVPVQASVPSTAASADGGEPETPSVVVAARADAGAAATAAAAPSSDVAAASGTAVTGVVASRGAVSGAAAAEAARAAVNDGGEGVRDGSGSASDGAEAAPSVDRAPGGTAASPSSSPPDSRPAVAIPALPSPGMQEQAGAPRAVATPDSPVIARVTGDASSPPAASAPTPSPASTTEAPEVATPVVSVPSAPAPAPIATPPLTPVAGEVASSPAHRAVAAQVAPVVVAIAQRPEGAHQLTMTVNPDTFGPVTVRAQIGHGGDVQVQLIGATDAGREALKAIVADLRRDLSAVMPHAALSLGSGTSADAGADSRGMPTSDGGSSGDQASGERSASRPQTSTPLPSGAPDIRPTASTTLLATAGAGLDIFV